MRVEIRSPILSLGRFQIHCALDQIKKKKMRGRMIKSIGLVLLCLCPLAGWAQESGDVVRATRLSEPITFDGMMDEAAWGSVPSLGFTMHWPSYDGDLTERTDMRIFYDDEYLYVGAICYDSDPGAMQETSFDRDDISEKADAIALIIDSYNDNENAQVFSVTLTGARADLTIKNDAQGADTYSMSWNSYWDAKVMKTNEGWHVEMRIPFSSLRFQVKDGKANMGIGTYRYIARKREMQIYPDVPPDWGYWSFAKPSKLQDMEFEGIDSKRPWYTSPYILGGLGHHHEYDDLDNANKIMDRDLELGLDVQHAFSENLNADFTINTDFAQVEADDQAVNLSRFSLFFPEKRRFFLERSSTFDFKADGNNNLFYSRRIGIDDGDLVPLLGGVRLVGRMQSWDVGVINMQSRKVQDIAPENFGVLRLRRNVFNSRSYLGGMFTSRANTEGYSNIAYGLDGTLNVFGDDYLKFNVAQSQDSEEPSGLDPGDRARIYVQWENRQTRGIGYEFSYSNVGDNYNPGLGFERRYNFSEYKGKLGYIKYMEESRDLRRVEMSVDAGTSLSNTTKNVETRSLGGRFALNWDRGNEVSLNTELLIDRVPEAFSLSDDIEIVPQEYQNIEYRLSYNTASVAMVNATVNMSAGKFYGGDLINTSISPAAILSKYLRLSGYYQYSYIDFADMGETFESHLARLKLSVSFNVKWSISGTAQYSSLNELSAVNMRLRYNPADGNDLYLVINEVVNNNPTAVTPKLPLSEARAVMVKYVHTFEL